MLRWLSVLLAVCLVTATADAQVFKPKTGGGATQKKAAAPAPAKKKTAKKQPRVAPTQKRVAGKKKAAAPSRDEEASSDAPAKGSEKDYVKIWDDDEIE